MVNTKDLEILIVDDNPQNLQFLANILSNEGYKIALSRSGEQVFTFLDKETPDLILLDIMMPKLNGFEVCIKLKKNKKTRNIPIIFITAKTEKEDIVKGFEVGAVDYVTKPFYKEELLARVRTHLRLKQAMEEIKALQGIIPICARCKKIRDDNGYWSQVDTYIEKNSDALVTHSICPNCEKELYGDTDWFKKRQKKSD